MQQQWEAFWMRVTEAAHHALWPFRASAELFGCFPSDMQIWCFLCAIFFSALVVPRTYGDLVLAERRSRAKGKVVRIDTSGETPSPTIEFIDRLGSTHRFDSDLPINSLTGTVGAEVAVIYDPFNPKIAREAGRPFAKVFHLIVWYSMIGALIAFSFWMPGG